MRYHLTCIMMYPSWQTNNIIRIYCMSWDRCNLLQLSSALLSMLLLFIHTVCPLMRVWQDLTPPPPPGNLAGWHCSPLLPFIPADIWNLRDRNKANQSRTQGEKRKGTTGADANLHHRLPTPRRSTLTPSSYHRSFGLQLVDVDSCQDVHHHLFTLLSG